MNRRILMVFAALLLALTSFGSLVSAQEKPGSVSAVHVIGIAGVKDNAKGALHVEEGQLRFVQGKNHFDISAASITDIATGDDTKAAVGKGLAVMSMAAPYGTGRALGLFRTKIDTLTVQYRGTDGELHGVIFAVADGAAESIKQALLAQGAHTSVGEGQGTSSAPAANSSNQEKKQ